MGHGQYKQPDTFVPAGTSVGVYADVDTTLAITLGMAVLANPGGYASVTTYASTNETIARINNYRVDALSHPEYQKMFTVESSKNRIIYIGYTDGFPSPSKLCTGTEQTCHHGIHRCDGILAKVEDNDIRLAFCIVPTARIGLAKMTTEFPDRQEYGKPRGDLGKARTTALQWLERMRKNPGAVDDFQRFATANPESSREAAFILSSSKELDDFLIIFDARKQRETLSPSGFLNYIQGLPPEAQKTVRDALQSEGGGKGAWKDSDSGMAPEVASFITSFFSRGTQARYEAWTNLTDQQREQAKENLHIGYWAANVVPVIRYYAELSVHGDQPLSSFTAVTYETGLPEEVDLELHESDGYKNCRKICMSFAQDATPQQKLGIWDRLGPGAQRFLTVVTGQSPEAWKNAATVPGRGWGEQAQQVATPEPKRSEQDLAEEKRLRQLEAEEEQRAKWKEWSEEFWDEDEVAAVNSRVARALDNGHVVTVLQVGERFKFVKMTQELQTAFPEGRWGTFKACDSGMDDVSLTPDGAVGVDITAFRAYLGQLSESMINFALLYKE